MGEIYFENFTPVVELKTVRFRADRGEFFHVSFGAKFVGDFVR